MPKTATFYAIYEEFDIFPILNFCPIWAVKKCSRVIFCVLDEYLTQKHASLPHTQNFKLYVFNSVTLDDLELSQGHKRLRRVLRSVLDTIHAVPSAFFQFDTIALPGEASNDKK